MEKLKSIFDTIKNGVTLKEWKILGIFALIALLSVGIYFLLNAAGPNESMTETCYTQQMEIAQAIKMHADEEDVFPAAENIFTKLSISQDKLHCPRDLRDKTTISYGYNAHLANKNLKEIKNPEDIALISDSDNAKNILLSEADFAVRHDDGIILAFADGHVTWGFSLEGGIRLE